jgi:hypothetical protein
MTEKKPKILTRDELWSQTFGEERPSTRSDIAEQLTSSTAGSVESVEAPLFQPQVPVQSNGDEVLRPPETRLTAIVCEPVLESQRLVPATPQRLPGNLKLIVGQDGHVYLHDRGSSNPRAMRLGSLAANATIRSALAAVGRNVNRTEWAELNQEFMAWAELYGERIPVWYRVAPLPDGHGIEIDLGDAKDTRVRITPGNVTLPVQGSQVVFYRSQRTRPMATPATVGNLDRLKKYVNLHPIEYVLFVAWLAYTLAHPKVASTKFLILVLQGGQGSGKTSLCNNVILKLLDPSVIGVQRMPANEKDFAIAVQNSHVVAFDNVRGFKSSISDLFCIVSTGGQVTSRQLYTDAEQSVLQLHGALVLNGIHSFVQQSDLAQRCLTLQLQPITGEKRRSDADLLQELEEDLPAIQRGLFDLIANIFQHLPTAKVVASERMIDFVKWLAAMEAAQGAPSGVFQSEYSNLLQQGQMDSLLDNPLAAEVLTFAEGLKNGVWRGTPTELFEHLNESFPYSTTRSREWPANPITLSKRLVGLQASLLTQGVRIELARGRQRTITITKVGGSDE